MLDLDKLKELPTVNVCAGPPLCPYEGDAAVTNSADGCVLCTRIAIHPDGTETRYRLPAQ